MRLLVGTRAEQDGAARAEQERQRTQHRARSGGKDVVRRSGAGIGLDRPRPALRQRRQVEIGRLVRAVPGEIGDVRTARRLRRENRRRDSSC